jgi:hypothetical protein
MDTGGCAAAAAHRVADPTAATPVGAKKRPADLTNGWTGTKKKSGEANSTAVVRSRKRSYEYTELELDVASDPEKMFKCNYWEDPAYAIRLQYFGLRLARSAALDNNCSRLNSEFDAWMASLPPPRR